MIYIVSASESVAQKAYNRRHDIVALNIHWLLCYYGTDCQTDKDFEHRKPDILSFKRDRKVCIIIYVASWMKAKTLVNVET